MKTEEELNAGILNITMAIGNQFPELSKYIAELSVDISLNGSSGENIKILQDYYDTLDALLSSYTATHSSAAKEYLLPRK